MSNKRFGWRQALLDEDVTKIWNELYRLVYLHPLVQAARNSGILGYQQYGGHTYTDLTQEIFLTLFQKGRFEHYIDTKMTDREIEHEISQIELTNLLVAHLRRQHPESYRLARRISTLVQNNTAFRRFDTLHLREGSTIRRRGLTEKVYGLAAWPDQKEIKERAMLDSKVHQVPMRVRNTREAGCTADAQIVISNADLLQLIIEVFEAIDSLADIKTLRNLVLSRLPIINIQMVPISKPEDDGTNSLLEYDIPDERANPEDRFLDHEFSQRATKLANKFLDQLAETVRRKPKQAERMLRVLWYCYLEPGRMSNVQLAKELGVSDSLVSDYCNRVNQQLKTLNLTIEQARIFEFALKRRTADMIGYSAYKQAA